MATKSPIYCFKLQSFVPVNFSKSALEAGPFQIFLYILSLPSTLLCVLFHTFMLNGLLYFFG